MKCTKCGSENVMVTVEQVSGKTKTNHTSIVRKFMRFFLILCTCGLWLLVPERKENGKIKFKNKTVCICQDCGNKWYC